MISSPWDGPTVAVVRIFFNALPENEKGQRPFNSAGPAQDSERFARHFVANGVYVRCLKNRVRD